MEKFSAPRRFSTRTPPNGTPNADSESARNLQTESGLETSRGGPKTDLRQNGHSFPAPRSGGAEKAKISTGNGVAGPEEIRTRIVFFGFWRPRPPAVFQRLREERRWPRPTQPSGTPKTGSEDSQNGTRGLPKFAPQDKQREAHKRNPKTTLPSSDGS